MFPSAFEYVRATSLREAFDALAKYGTGARVLAGGQSLIPAMRYRLAAPAVLVDINPIAELAYVREDKGVLRIGALARHSDVGYSALVADKCQLMADAAVMVADPIVRYRGTLAGSIAHNDPAADWCAAAVASRATVVVTRATGSRTVDIDKFLVDSFKTALEPGEIVTEIRWPIPDARSSGAYLKIERKVGDFAVAAVAVQISLDERGRCRQAGIGLCAVGPMALRATAAESILSGSDLSVDAIREASAAAAKECDPAADSRGGKEFKRDLIRVLVARALATACARLQRR
jgi:carbon-monoxide dehydrogenase medium subunit